MPSYKKILLAMDFSEPAHNALEHAAVIARQSGAAIHALHINIVPYERRGEEALPEAADYQLALAKASQGYLEALPQPDDVEVVNAVIDDFSPTHGILRYAEQEKVDLIVMGTHGRTGLSRLLMGSVAAQVLRGAKVPALVVGKGDAHQVSPEGLRRIVAATDLSEASGAAVRHAAALAVEHGAGLHVVHVLVPPPSTPYDIAVALNPTDEDAGRKALSEFLAGLSLPVEASQEVVTGVAHKEVHDAAERQEADLIVVGAGGHSALEQFLLGSVADRVARGAPCPVLVYRDAGAG